MTKLGSGGGSALSRLGGGGGTPRPIVDPAYQQNPQLAEAQRLFRQQSSTAQIGEAYAASRVLSAQESAQRELDKVLRLKELGMDIPDDRIKELENVANPDFWRRTQVRALETAAPIFKALELIDRPRQLITLFANDVLQWDQKDDTEIELGHYGDLIMGRKDKLLDELGAAVVGEDGMIGFSTVLDDVGWELDEDSGFLERAARFTATLGGEILTDPLTYMTFGASTLGKAQRGRHLIKVVDDAVGNTAAAMKGAAAVAEPAEQWVNKGGRIVKEVLDPDVAADAARATSRLDEMDTLGKHLEAAATPKAQSIEATTWDRIEAAIRGGSDEDVAFLNNYGLSPVDPVDEFGDAAVNYAVAQAKKSPDIQRKVFNDAVDQATVEAGDELWNRAAPALVAKDYADPTLRMVAQGMDSKMLSGGVKLIMPIYSARTGKAVQLLPGGTGRRITNALFGHSSEYAKAGAKRQASGARKWLEEGIASPLYDRWRATVEQWGDDGLWRNVMRGNAPAARQMMRARDEFAKSVIGLTNTSGMSDLARSSVAVKQAAEEAGMSEKDVRVVMRGIGRILETRPGATADEVLTDLQQGIAEAGGNLADVPKEFATQLQAWAVQTRRTLDRLHELADEAGIEGLGDKLQNYMPHMLTGEANEMLDNMLALGVEPRGDAIGAQLLRALLEGRRRATTAGETVVAEATGATERTIGRTVASGTDDLSVPLILGDTVMHDKSSFGLTDLTAEELNKTMREALDELEAAEPNFKRPKQGNDLLDFEIYNENPFVTVQAYSHDMLMAVAESKFVSHLQEIGVVSDAVTYVNKQDLARSVLKNLGKYGNDVVERQQQVIGKIIDDKMRLIRSIEDAVDVAEETTPMKVRIEGGTETIQIPTAALEANKGLARRVAKMNSAAEVGEAANEAALVFYKDTFNALSRQGTDPQTASALAQAATRKEIREILKEARGTIKTKVREQLQEYNLARATTHRDRLAANEAAYREAVAQFHAQADIADEALAEIDAALGRGGEVATDVPRPIGNDHSIVAVNNAMREANVERVRDVARRARDQGFTDQALQVEAVADFLERAGMRFEDVAAIESLGNGIGELVQEMNNLSAARTDYLNVHRETYVAQASGMMDQAYYYADGFLDSGSWGDRYVNAQFVFHGTDRPNASQLALTEKFGGGGLTPNPVRATRYAGSQWVVVYRMDDLPSGVANSLRAGQDVESRNQLLTLSGSGAQREQMPQPIAVIPAAAMREAAIRSANDPQQLRNIGREAGANTLMDMFGERASTLFRENSAVDEYWRLIDRAFDDPTYAGTDEFYESMFELIAARSEVPLSENWSIEAFDRFHERLTQEFMDRRAWSREGQVSEYNGKPPDIRGDAARKRVIKTWWDNWGDKARDQGSKPMADVGQPVTAAWIDPYRVVNGNQGANQLYDQLHSKRTPARFDPVVWDEADVDDVGTFSIPHQIVNVEIFFEEEFHLLRSGQMSDEMRDLYEASQVSLAGRGLPDEFPVWIVGGAQENYGMAKMSLVPVEGATVYTVKREDVALDWGAMFPNENLTPDAISLRHQIYVDPSKLREAQGSTPSVKLSSRGDDVTPLPVVEGLPPLKAGYKRLYRADIEGGTPTTSTPGRYWTDDFEVVENFYADEGVLRKGGATGGRGATVSYIDVPEAKAAQYRQAAEESGETGGAFYDEVEYLVDDAKGTPILRRGEPDVNRGIGYQWEGIPQADETLGLSTTTGWIPAASWQNMKPQNLTIERMMATFGDPDVAENAYRDLMERLNLVPNVTPKALQAQAEMTLAAQGWSNVSTRGGTQIGILRGVEQIYTQPERMGSLLEHPDVRRWYATQVKENLGLDVQFTEITLVPDGRGAYRAGLSGQEGGVKATVPVFTERVMQPALDAAETQTLLREKGWTQSDARMLAARKQEYDSLSVQQFNDLPPKRQGQLSAANAAFEGEDALYNTINGYTDEMGQAMDRATEAAEQAARLNGTLDNTTELLLGPPTQLAEGQARGRAHQALNQLVSVPLDTNVRSAVSVRTGQNAVRGYLITPGTGRTRYAVAEGAITEDWIEEVRQDVADWVAVNHEDLSRPGAHIVWRREGDEMVLEIGGTTNSVREARKRGMDTVDNEVYDLLTGERIAVPDTLARVEAQVARATRDTEALDLLQGIDKQIKGNRWDIAEGRLVEHKNKQLITELIGEYEYENLLEQVKLERLLALNMVPDKEARRAASRARRMMGDPVKAREALDGVEAEARATQVATLSEEINELMEVQVQITDLLREILGVGINADTRDLSKLQLYPTFQGEQTVEASQVAVARAKELKALAEELGWDDMDRAMQAVLGDVPYKTMAAPGQQTFSVWGIGGRQMQFKAADAATAQFIEQAVSRWQAITTPEGLDMFAKQLNWVARAWKTMATVARPNFHPRNLVGGTFNNMAIGVTMQNYANSVAIGRKLNRLRRANASPAEYAEAFGDQWEVVEAAINTGIFGEGFAAGDLRLEVPRGKGAVRARDAILNPASGDWIPARIGGAAMENVEGFLRFAAFDRYYDELGAEGARDMVNMTQFNYANVNQMDARFKKYIPFWIWTKNNVPLQVRMMLEDPGVVARYTHLMSAVDDNFGGEQDDYPLNQFMSPFAASIGVQLGDDQSWARMVFDPDVPITDLGPFIDNPLSPEYYGSILSNMLGPQFTTPMQIADQNDWGKTNAPMGLSTILKGLDMLGVYDANITAAGDVQVGYGTKNAFSTLFPILNEYASIGGMPAGPNAQQKLGVTDDEDLGQRLRGGATFLTRGFGFDAITPNDTRIAAFHAEKRVQEIMNELRLAGQIPPETPDLVVRQYLAELGITGNS